MIADLSTANANALYELGVRHALRPHATIVIAEDKGTFPFNLNHVSIAKSEHLGKDIGFGEVMRMRVVLARDRGDSRQTGDRQSGLLVPSAAPGEQRATSAHRNRRRTRRASPSSARISPRRRGV